MSENNALSYWEDFTVGDVQEFGNMLVTEADIVRFATEFDPQPFHVDAEAAKSSLFKGLCASGWHTCAMAMRIMCDHYLLKAHSLGSPGMDSKLNDSHFGTRMRGEGNIAEIIHQQIRLAKKLS